MTAGHKDVTGYIIAGGKSRRLGFDKRKFTIDGKSLLDIAYTLLNEVLNRKSTIIGDNLDWLDKHEYRVLLDTKPNCGPLGGVVTALKDCTTKWALIIACDLPLLNSLIIEELLRNANEEVDMVALSSSEKIEPLIALYNSSTREFWEERLNDGKLKLISGIDRLNLLSVKTTQPAVLKVNINTADDLPIR